MLLLVSISIYAIYDSIQVQYSAIIPEELAILAEDDEAALFRRLEEESKYVVG